MNVLYRWLEVAMVGLVILSLVSLVLLGAVFFGLSVPGAGDTPKNITFGIMMINATVVFMGIMLLWIGGTLRRMEQWQSILRMVIDHKVAMVNHSASNGAGRT